jgi:hypothetical protein
MDGHPRFRGCSMATEAMDHCSQGIDLCLGKLLWSIPVTHVLCTGGGYDYSPSTMGNTLMGIHYLPTCIDHGEHRGYSLDMGEIPKETFLILLNSRQNKKSVSLNCGTDFFVPMRTPCTPCTPFFEIFTHLNN